MDEEKIETIRNKYGLPFHYYGDVVRRLFILSAVLMIATLPFLSNRLPVSVPVSILVIVVLSIAAGFIAPRNRFAIYVNFAVSVTAVIIFEYYAVLFYKAYSAKDSLFIADQSLAVIFLFASYYASKTIRSLINK